MHATLSRLSDRAHCQLSDLELSMAARLTEVAGCWITRTSVGCIEAGGLRWVAWGRCRVVVGLGERQWVALVGAKVQTCWSVLEEDAERSVPRSGVQWCGTCGIKQHVAWSMD
jgi:hypothetical protein